MGVRIRLDPGGLGPYSQLKMKLRMPRRAAVAATAILAMAAGQAGAVPIPWKNCGHPGDIISMQQFDASVWPPRGGTAAPLEATATYDPGTGNLVALRVHLLFGVDWIFEATGLDVPVVDGFVTLPVSLPMSLVSPTLPVPAGPVNIVETFMSGSMPVTISSKATIGQAITSANVVVALSFNGNPGFPRFGGVGSGLAQVQVAESDGQAVFCMTYTQPGESFVNATASIPTLSWQAAALLAGLLAAVGFLALRR
jgi:hypothetical protein